MNKYSDYLSNDRFAIFLFHGVVPEARHQIRNYTKKHLTLDRFTEVLRDLSNKGCAVSIEDIVAAHENRLRLPEKAFVVSFDDGFENNYSIAAPVLSRMKIPSVFYVTTRFVEADESSWIDIIERAVENTLSFRLMLPFRSEPKQYKTREDKIRLLDEIRAYVKGHRNIDPYGFAENIREQIEVECPGPDPYLDRKMNWQQVAELAEHPGFVIGGHSHTHRILAFLNEGELENEIDMSLDLLHQHLGHPVLHYSYPEGNAQSYSEQVIRTLQNRGVVCAPTAEEGTNQVDDDLFHLKRIPVVE